MKTKSVKTKSMTSAWTRKKDRELLARFKTAAANVVFGVILKVDASDPTT